MPLPARPPRVPGGAEKSPIPTRPAIRALPPVLLILLASLAPPEIYPLSGAAVALLAAGMALGLAVPVSARRGPVPSLGAVLAAAALVGLQALVAVRPGAALGLGVHLATATFLYLHLRREGETVRRLALLALAAAATVLSLDALHQKLLRLGPEVQAMLPSWVDPEAARVRLEAGRVFSHHLLPASFGGFLVLGLAATLALVCTVRGRRRVVGLAAAGLQAVALLLTVSVGALASVSLAGLLVAGTLWRKHRSKIWAAGVLLIVVLVVAAALRPVPVFDLDHPDNPLKLRAGNARAAILLFLERPLAGWGGGGFAVEYPRLRRAGDNETLHAHNTFLEVLAEGGLAAGLFLVAGLAALLRLWRRLARHRPDPAIPFLLAGVLAFLLQNAFDFTALLPGIALPFCAVAAALPPGRPPGRTGTGTVLAAVLIALSAVGLATVALAEAHGRIQWSHARTLVDRALEAGEPSGEAGASPGERVDGLRVEARDRLLRAARFAPWNGAALSWAAEIEVDRINEGRGAPLASVGWAREALERDPHGFRRHLAAARAHAAAGQVAESYTRAAEARRRNPGSVLAARLEEELRPAAALGSPDPAGQSREAPRQRDLRVSEWFLLALAPLSLLLLVAVPVLNRRTLLTLLPVAIVILLPWGEGGALPEAVLLRQVLVVVLLLTVAWRREPTAAPVLHPGPVVLALAPAALWSFLAAALADHPAAALSGAAGVAGSLALLTAASTAGRDDTALLRRVVAALSASGLVLALLALLEFLRTGDRPAVDFLNASHLGTYLILGTAAWTGWAVVKRGPARLLCGAGAGFCLAGALLTGSRGGLLGLGVAGVVFLVAAGRLRWGRPVWRWVGVLLLAGVLVVGALSVSHRFRRGDPYRWTRLGIWSASIEAVSDRPVLGFGPDVFPHRTAPYQFPQEGPFRFERPFLGPHSDLLGAALSAGLPGLLLLLAGLAFAGRAAWHAVRREEDPGTRPLMVAALFGCGVVAVHALVDDVSDRPALLVTAALLLTMVAARGRGPSPALQLPAQPGRWLLLVAAPALIALGFLEVAPLLAYEVPRLHPGGVTEGLALAARCHPFQPGVPLEQARLIAGPEHPLDARSFARAESLIRRSERLDPEGHWAPEARAGLYLRAGIGGLFPAGPTLETAVAAMKMAVQRAPFQPFLRADLARLLAVSGRFEAALVAIDRALGIEPYFLHGRLDRVEYLLALGRTSEAASELVEVRRRIMALDGTPLRSPYAQQLLPSDREREERLAARLEATR